MEDSKDPPEGRLLKIYPPDDAEDNTLVDIIAIHGLGTSTPRTWEYKTKTGTVNWLSDLKMLPGIVSSARISTFSWNAKYYADASVARICNVAEVLLSNLQSQRDIEKTHSKPLVFVASCFGGLIVTKALEIANIHGNQCRKLLVATTGVVFLASPLQGTKAGKAAQWRAMLGGILNKGPSQTLIQDLDGSTRALRETSENFVKMVTTSPMQTMTMCFWETQKTQVLKAILPPRILRLFRSGKIILVEEDSACLFGRPKQHLDAPHSMMNKFSGPGDANFGLVSNAIKKMVNEAKKIAVSQREAFPLRNEYFMVSRRPNPFFTGREEEIQKLKQELCPSSLTTVHTAVPRVFVIHGMGGAGKSEVALKFAHENRQEFWGVFWIDGRSESSIINGFAAIARRCGHHDESLEGAMLWLQEIPHSWLLVLDNADNEDLDLARFLPAGRNGSILVTTRLPACAKYQSTGHPSAYERLNLETAIELLLKACEIEVSLRGAQRENARAVAELLGCHALAIIQAGAAVSQGLCGLGKYKEVFLHQRQELLECFPKQAGSEYGGVYATFEVSATYIETRGGQIAKDALQLLNFYAFMHFTDFPEVAFEEAWENSREEDVVTSSVLADGGENIENLAPWHVSHLPTFMQKNIHDDNLDKIRLSKARLLPSNLSLVAFDSARSMTRMHPVTHVWSRDRLQKPEESMNAALNGLSVLSLSIRDPFEVDVDVLSTELQPHIESIAHHLKEWNHDKPNFPIQQSVYRLSWVMLGLQCESALLEMLEMIPIEASESWIKTENGQYVQLLHSYVSSKFGDVNKATHLLEQINEVRVHTLAADHPTLLRSQHELAKLYLEIEETAKAIELLERVLHTRSETLSPEHAAFLSSQHELARAYLKIREMTKAISLFEEVVKMRTRTLRPEHPNRLNSQHELARAYLDIGETAKAISLLEAVVEIKARTLRPEHLSRLISQHDLAAAYLHIGETAKAISLLESVVEIRARTLRAEHSDRLSSQHELARAYLDIGETGKAIALLESVVEIRTRTLRADHRDRVSSIFVLANCHYRAKNYERALQLARSIEDVAQNRPGGELADFNAELIGYILEEMETK